MKKKESEKKMIYETFALIINCIMPYGIGLFFVLFSSFLNHDERMAKLSKNSGVVIIVTTALWFLYHFLRILF